MKRKFILLLTFITVLISSCDVMSFFEEDENDNTQRQPTEKWSSYYKLVGECDYPIPFFYAAKPDTAIRIDDGKCYISMIHDRILTVDVSNLNDIKAVDVKDFEHFFNGSHSSDGSIMQQFEVYNNSVFFKAGAELYLYSIKTEEYRKLDFIGYINSFIIDGNELIVYRNYQGKDIYRKYSIADLTEIFKLSEYEAPSSNNQYVEFKFYDLSGEIFLVKSGYEDVEISHIDPGFSNERAIKVIKKIPVAFDHFSGIRSAGNKLFLSESSLRSHVLTANSREDVQLTRNVKTVNEKSVQDYFEEVLLLNGDAFLYDVENKIELISSIDSATAKIDGRYLYKLELDPKEDKVPYDKLDNGKTYHFSVYKLKVYKWAPEEHSGSN